VVRQVSPGRQRASVERDRSSGRLGALSLTKSLARPSTPSGPPSSHDEQGRRYPAMALLLVLVLGIVLGLLLAALISSVVGGGGSSSSTPRRTTPSAIATQQDENRQTAQRSDELQAAASPESRDVRILGCGTDSRGYASARVLVTNSTNERSTYYVRVLFTAASDGRIISDDVASVKRLLPGKTSPLLPVDAVDAAPGEQVLCRLGSVSRF
jgi:hypothetical protein